MTINRNEIHSPVANSSRSFCDCGWPHGPTNWRTSETSSIRTPSPSSAGSRSYYNSPSWKIVVDAALISVMSPNSCQCKSPPTITSWYTHYSAAGCGFKVNFENSKRAFHFLCSSVHVQIRLIPYNRCKLFKWYKRNTITLRSTRYTLCRTNIVLLCNNAYDWILLLVASYKFSPPTTRCNISTLDRGPCDILVHDVMLFPFAHKLKAHSNILQELWLYGRRRQL